MQVDLNPIQTRCCRAQDPGSGTGRTQKRYTDPEEGYADQTERIAVEERYLSVRSQLDHLVESEDRFVAGAAAEYRGTAGGEDEAHSG